MRRFSGHEGDEHNYHHSSSQPPRTPARPRHDAHSDHRQIQDDVAHLTDDRDSMSAALDEIHRRRDCLSRGAVLEKRPVHTPEVSVMGATGNRGLMLQHAAMGMLSSSIEDHATSKATTSAIHHRHAALNPVNTTAAPVKTAAPPQRIVWVRKPIQRWRPTQNTMQEVGSVEFATLAPLASIRRLIDQFHPLPDKREYEFYHPSLRTRIDPSEELSVFPAEFPYILLAALPPPHRIKAQHQPAPQSEAISAAHKTADDQAVLVHPHRTNATAAPAKTMKKAPAHPGSMEARTATTPSSQPAAYRDVLLRNKLVSGVRCDFTVREFPERNLVGLKAQLREGSWSGRSTPIKWLSMEEVKHLTKQTAQEDASTKYHLLINELELQVPSSSQEELCIVVRGQKRGVQEVRQRVAPTSCAVHEGDIDAPTEVDTSASDTAQTLLTPPPADDDDQLLRGTDAPTVEAVQPIVPSVRETPPASAMYIEPIVDERDIPLRPDPLSVNTAAAVPFPNEQHTCIEGPGTIESTFTQEEDPLSKMRESGNAISPPGPSQTLEFDGQSSIVQNELKDPANKGIRPETILNDAMHDVAEQTDESAMERPKSAATIPPIHAEKEDKMEEALSAFDLTDVEYVPGLDGLQSDIQAMDTSFPVASGDSRESVTLAAVPADVDGEAASTHAGFADKRPVSPDSDIPISPRQPDEESEEGEEGEDDVISEVPGVTAEPMSPRNGANVVHPSEYQQQQFENWDSGLAESQGLQRYIRVVMEKFVSGFEDAQRNSNHADTLFTMDQLQKSFLHYGIDHLEFGLNGVFLAIEDDLHTYASQLVGAFTLDTALKAYLLTLLPPRSIPANDDASDLSWLFRLECALNVLADMRAWHEPTRIRIACIEKHAINTFLPAPAAATTTSSTPSAATADQKLSAFRLSDKDRELLSVVHTNEQLVSSAFDVWITDGLEIFYLFLYSFLNSHRNSGAITKMNFCRTRVERVQTVVQKVITLDPTAWRKMEFLYSEIEDAVTLTRIQELVDQFLSGQRAHLKGLESCIFFQALVAFISRKADHISQSLLQFVSTLHPATTLNPPPATTTTLTPTARCIASFREQLEMSRLDASSPFEGYLRNIGLKAIDMDKINKVRSGRNLPRMNLSGKYSLATHHHCELMGSDYALHLRPRWNHARLNVGGGATSRYFFHGEPSIALEAVYVRRKIDLAELQNKSWEEKQRYAEEDAREAFKLLCSGAVMKTGGNILLGIGVNTFHLDLLQDFGRSDWNSMILENPKARSLSMGYFVSKDADIAAVRILFRVHVDVERPASRTEADGMATLSITESLQNFLLTAKEDALLYVLETNGLSFLFGCLEENVERRWRNIVFGVDFYQQILASNVSVQYHRDAVLNCMSAFIRLLPKSIAAVSKRNVQIVTELVVLLRSTSATEVKLVETALKVLKVMCSPQEKPRSSAPLQTVEPFTELQRKFAAEEGLKFLVNAADLLTAASPSRQLALEETILRLMRTTELSANRAALLVHWRHWMTYFIENAACVATRENSDFLPLLLQEIHNHFILRNISESDPSSTVFCSCGCKGTASGSIKSVSGIVKVFLRLLLYEKGVIWGQDGMSGPMDCLVFFSWTLTDPSAVLQVQQQSLQLLIFDTLCEFLLRMKSADRYLHFLSAITPKLLELLATLVDATLRRAVLRTLSLALEASIEKSVWKISKHSFLDSLYSILQALCSDPSTSSSYMNKLMTEVLFHHNGANSWGMPVKPPSDSAEVLRALLHQEYIEGQSRPGAKAPSSGRSLLQSLLLLMNVPPGSPLQPFCQIPILVVLGWLVNSPLLAEDCAELEMDVALQALVEGEALFTSILAARVLCVLHFQLMSTTRKYSDNLLKRFVNALTIMMGVGGRMSLSRHQHPSGGADSGTEQLRLSADGHDSYLILERFVSFNKCHMKSSKHEENLGTREQIWYGHEWEDPERVLGDKLAAFLNLLAVFSCLANSIVQVKDSEEIKQLQLLLWRFIRDREFVSENHMALYLFALRNIVFALRSELFRLNELSIYNDHSFLQKLLLYSRKKSAKLLPELASGLLWALASAFESTDILAHPFVVDFDDPDAVAALMAAPAPPGSVPRIPTTNGIIVLSENILAKLTSGGAIDCDIGALSSLLKSRLCDDIFLGHYGYPFVIKLIDNIQQAGLSGVRRASVFSTSDSLLRESAICFGPILVYGERLPRRDKELIQLCRLAHSCLAATFRSKPKTVEDMIPRTKSKVLTLLDHDNALLLHQVLLCLIVHLKAHPQKCTELVESSAVDAIIALAFEPSYERLQATAFTCLRMMLIDPKCLTKQYGLDDKLFDVRRQIISCLRSSNFEVKKQALVLAVDLVFHLQDEQSVRTFAAIFLDPPENQTLLSDLFSELSTAFEANPETGYVLQLLVRLVVRLDLIALTDTEQLVGAICFTLELHNDTTFLRPLLCNCLFRIASEADKVESFARKSRLNTITDLLLERLTLGELRSIGNLLTIIAEQHEGICAFFSRSESGCIAKISKVLGAFFEISSESGAAGSGAGQYTPEDGDMFGELAATEANDHDSARYVVKMTSGKRVFISHFTDDIYEQSSCGRVIARFLVSRRILLRSSYDLHYFLGTSGMEAPSLAMLSLQLLSHLAFSHQNRVEIQRGYPGEWSWVKWIMEHCAPERSELVATASTNESQGLAWENASLATMSLARFCAEKAVALYVSSQGEFVLSLFSRISIASAIEHEEALDLQRAALFALARLAEYRRVVMDPLFQEKTASLLAHVDAMHADSISLANMMVLSRNFSLFTPGMQGRVADEVNLSALLGLLGAGDDGIAYLVADVLAHALYFVQPAASNPLKKSSGATSAHRKSIPAGVMPPAGSQVSKSPGESLRRALLPSWKRLVSDSKGEEDGNMILLEDELDVACSMLPRPALEELLRLLVALHLRVPERSLSAERDADAEYDPEGVIPKRNQLPPAQRRRPLQYVLPASFRNSLESDDASFHGSAHMWQFLRKIWRMCLRRNSSIVEIFSHEEQISSLSQIAVILSRWKPQTGCSISAMTYERRARFVGFSISVIEVAPQLFNSVAFVDEIVGVVEGFLGSPSTVGVAYELLYILCNQRPETVDWITQHFQSPSTDDEDTPRMSASFRRLLGGVTLEHLLVTMSVAKAKGHETGSSVAMLDPRAPSTPALAFAIGLLNILSARSPVVLTWFVECQSAQLLFDLLIMDTNYTGSLAPHVRYAFVSSLVGLLVRLLELHPDLTRWFVADARILYRVVRLVYSLKSHVQLAALELLQRLMVSPEIKEMLFRMEYFSSSMSAVEDWMVDCFQERCSQLQVTPAFRPREVAELAHLSQLPFFLDLKTTELVHLSMCFVESHLVEKESLMIIARDGRFGRIPEWMVADALRSEAAASVYLKKFQALKRIEEEFQHAVDKKSAKGSLLLYKISKEGYWRCTTPMTRKVISERIVQFLTRDEQFVGHDRHTHASTGLISRVCRFLIEDRAELVRRVAFTKQLSEQTVLAEISKKKLNDLLSLLCDCPFFNGLGRDKLACLAYRLSSPVQIAVAKHMNDQTMPLMLLLDEDVEYELLVLHPHEAKLSGILHRGSLIGFPRWLIGEPRCEPFFESQTSVDRANLFIVTLAYEDLQAELGDADVQALIQRFQNLIRDDGGLRQHPGLKAAHETLSKPPRHGLERKQLQNAGLSLLLQLVSSREFATRFLTNVWAVQIVYEVATSALSSRLVGSALEILRTLAEDELLCKRLCNLEVRAIGDETNHGCPNWASNLRLFLGLMQHFSIVQWAADASILDKFFRIQHHVIQHIPVVTNNIRDVWTMEYMQQCQHVLQQDIDSQFRTAETVAAHLSLAMHLHADFVMERSRALSLHLDVIRILTRLNSSPQCVHLLRLLSFFCADKALRVELWMSGLACIEAFDPALVAIAADLDALHKTTRGLHESQEEAQQRVQVYCGFVQTICAADIDEELDLAFRERVERKFSLLLILVRLISRFEALRNVILRCIGVICLDTPQNCSIVQGATMHLGDSTQKTSFAEYVMQLVDALHSDTALTERGADVEALLLCAQALSHSIEGAQVFIQKGFVAIAMGFLRALPEVPSASHLLAWRALVLSLRNLFEYARGDFLRNTEEDGIQILMRFFSQLSDWFRSDEGNNALGRLFRDTFRFLAVLMGDPFSREALFRMHLQDPVQLRRVTHPFYHWILGGHSADANAATVVGKLHVQQLGKDLEIASLALFTSLFQDPRITLLLASHPELMDVMKVIFQRLQERDGIFEGDQARILLRFLCFFLEQVLVTTDTAAFKFLKAFSVPVIIRFAHSASVLDYAMRLLWLYQQICARNPDSEGGIPPGLSTDEVGDFLNAAADHATLVSANPRTTFSMLGLAAELLKSGRVRGDLLARLLRRLLLKLPAGELIDLKRISQVEEIQTEASLYSAIEWDASSSSVGRLPFGVLHQCIRCFRYFAQDEVHALLGEEKETPSGRIFQSSVFGAAIQLLSFHATSEFSQALCFDSLAMIGNVLQAFTSGDDGASSLHARLQSYRRVAKQNNFALRCCCLLESPSFPLRHQTVRVLNTYGENHMSIWDEIEGSRRKESRDLLDALLQCLEHPDPTAVSDDLDIDTLRVFNTIIQHSYITNVHARDSRCLERLVDMRNAERRLSAISPRQHDFDLECARTYHFILRMCKQNRKDTRLVARDLWSLLHTLLVESPQSGGNTATLTALECIVGSDSAHYWLAQSCSQDWSHRGRRLFERLVEIASFKPSSEDCVPVGKSAVHALGVFCSYAFVLDNVLGDRALVQGLFANLTLQHPNYRDRLQVISGSIKLKLEMRQSLEQVSLAASIPCILERYEALNSILVEHRVAYLELLPAVVAPCQPTCSFGKNGASMWKLIIGNVLFFLQHGSQEEAAAAHTALQVVMAFDDNRSIMSEALPVLKKIWTRFHKLLEQEPVETNEPTGVVCFFQESDARRALGSHRSPRQVRRYPRYLQLPTQTSHELGLTISTLLQLGRVASLSSTHLRRWVQYSISLWMSQVYYMDRAPVDDFLGLSELLFSTLKEKNIGVDGGIWESVPHLASFCNLLITVISSNQPCAPHYVVQNILLMLLEADASAATTNTSSKASSIRSALTTTRFDTIDSIWWSVFTTPAMFAAEHDCIALWCQILRFMCVDLDFSRRVMETHLLHHFVWETLLDCCTAVRLSDPNNESLLALFTTIFRLHQWDQDFLNKHIALFDTVAGHCVRTVALVAGFHTAKYDAIELLRAFSGHDRLLRRIWKTCLLSHDDTSKGGRTTRMNYLRGLTDMLQMCNNDAAALDHSLFVVHKLCLSELGVGPLIRSRRRSKLSMSELVRLGIQQTVGTSQTLVLRLHRNIATSELTDFLPSCPDPSLNVAACKWSLQILRLCMADKTFVDALQHEIGIFSELFAALGCPDWEISHDAAVLISKATKTFDHANEDHCKADAEEEEEDVHELSRYICSTDPATSSLYRRLAFFAVLDEQIVFDMQPDDAGFPSCYMVLVVWVQFYAKNLHLLQKQCTTFVHEMRLGDDGEETPRRSKRRSIYEQHLVSVLDILLYVLANYFPVVYDVTGEVPVPEEKAQHTLLCSDLLVLCKRHVEAEQHQIVVEDDLIRCKALSLLQLVCSFDLYRYAVEVFTQEVNVTRLLVIIERTKSVQEQRAAVRVLCDVTSYPSVKDLFVTHQALLLRVCAWLENPRLEHLQPFAMGILQNLATKSVRKRHQNVFTFAPSFQDQLARSLFHGKQFGRKASIANYTLPKELQARKVDVLVSFHPKKMRYHLGTQSSFHFPIFVKMHVKIFRSKTHMHRGFQLTFRIRSVNDHISHLVVVEDVDCAVSCKVALRWVGDNHLPCKVKQFATHSLTATEVRSLSSSATNPRQTTMNLLIDSGHVVVGVSDQVIDEPSEDLGPLGRLLRHENIELPILEDATNLVAELSKNHQIFCDPKLKLWDHMLSALGSSAAFARQQTHTRGQDASGVVDLSCLHSLSSWFWSKPGVSFFKTSMIPLMQLIRGMRKYGFAIDILTREPSRTRVLPNDESKHRLAPADSSKNHHNFLTALLEWIAAIETPDSTDNYLNILFLENTDVLLFLCSHIFPARSVRASFFFLVATAVRINMVHCEVFARKHALQLLLDIVNAPGAGEDEASRVEMLCYAARVIAKICRCSTAREKFAQHGGMTLFGRVAFVVFRAKWHHQFPLEAAENLVLAASFLCDFIVQPVFIDPTNQRDMGLVSHVLTMEPHAVVSSAPSLSVIETLLHFLGRASHPMNDTRFARDERCFDSFDRLAASVFSSLVEKHPHRISFERNLLELLLQNQVNTGDSSTFSGDELKDSYTAGLKRCIALTKWGFESDMNVIRRTYYAGVCGGVRTGVTPPQCRNAFLRFDQDFLLNGASRQFASNKFADTRSMTSRMDGYLNTPHYENQTARAESREETSIVEELNELTPFADEHEELVKTLTENRKRHLTQSIKVADRNARVLTASHSVLSLAFDFSLDLLAPTQTENEEDRVELARPRHSEDVNATVVIQEWLTLLEELSGLVCCALHELDFNYYEKHIQQLHALVSELPTFLQKMERVQSKKHTLLLFLKNLNNILRRIANKNELKGVAGNGFGVAEEARRICERLRQMEPEVSAALAHALSSKVSLKRFARMLVAMDYMWKRVFGSSSLSEFMAGTAQSTEGLVAKLKRRIRSFLAFLVNPVPFFTTQTRKIHILLSTIATSLLSNDQASSGFHDVSDADKVKPSHVEEGTNTSQGDTHAKATSGSDISYFPFCSMESLLDHFGYTSLRAKKTKQIIAIPTLKHRVLRLLSRIFASPVDTIEKLSVIQLEAHFQQLPSDQVAAVFRQLRTILDEADAGIQIRLVEKLPLELSLWRFLVRPIQRIRLFHLYFLVGDFLSHDSEKRQEILDQYRRDEETYLRRKNSLFEANPPAARENDHLREVVVQHNQEHNEPTAPQTVVRKPRARGRRQTLLSNLGSGRLKLKIGTTLESPIVQGLHAVQIPSPDELFNDDVLTTCDRVSFVDPLAEEVAIQRLRHALRSRKQLDMVPGMAASYRKYLLDHTPRWVTRFRKKAQIVFLLLVFWRQEELAADLKNELLAKAFDSNQEREEYFLSFHARKASAELVRVWMPESGNLGLRLWQMREYLIGGTFVSIVIAFILPLAYGYDDSQRNVFMTQIIYAHVAIVFLLSTLSILSIARKHFVLQERDRIRFSPAVKYYQNALAVVSILVELVQLNSLTFDSATIEWNKTDQIPKLVQWLGEIGITEIGIAQIDLKAVLCFLVLVVWFFMLKSANKFQDSNPVLNHLFTKDLPSLFNGFLYMGIISTFFSFLSCIDCKESYGSQLTKCTEGGVSGPPFLLSHKSIACWSREHQKYAFLGIWGITFFLPIGLLSHGMNQVLFQQEKLDIKYAPVILLFSQLVKAMTATAKAFFTFNSLACACIGLTGNGVLLLLMSTMKSSSLWFVKLIKSGIYAASCWSSICTIYQIQTGTTPSMSLIYIGWLTVAAITISAILWRLRRQAERKQREDQVHWALHRSLLAAANASEDSAKLSQAEKKFLDTATRRAATPSIQAAIFAKKAQQLSADEPPAELEQFMRHARALANGKYVESNQNPAIEAAFMKNARMLSKKVDSNENLRLRTPHTSYEPRKY